MLFLFHVFSVFTMDITKKNTQERKVKIIKDRKN